MTLPSPGLCPAAAWAPRLAYFCRPGTLSKSRGGGGFYSHTSVLPHGARGIMPRPCAIGSWLSALKAPTAIPRDAMGRPIPFHDLCIVCCVATTRFM